MRQNTAACLCLCLPAGTTLSQNITEATVTTISLSIDSVGTGNDDWIFSGDPSLSSYAFDMFSEIEEPIWPPFGQPSFHRSSNVGEIEAVGSIWTGSAMYSVEYPDTLDLGTDIGDPNIESGSLSHIFQTVAFSLDQPTQIELSAMFRTDQIDPLIPSNPLDGFVASIRQDGTTLLTTDFAAFASGIDQVFDGALLLGPGDYEFRTFAALTALESFGYRSATSSFDYTLTFVPAPATVMLFLSTGLLARRKRD